MVTRYDGNALPEGTREQLVDAIRECGSFEAASKRIGIATVTAYRWRAADPIFAEACLQAKREAVGSLEACFYEQAIGSTGSKPSFLHGIAWLKANDPDGKYRDNVSLDVRHSGMVGIVDLSRLPPDTLQAMLTQAAQRYLAPPASDTSDDAPPTTNSATTALT